MNLNPAQASRLDNSASLRMQAADPPQDLNTTAAVLDKTAWYQQLASIERTNHGFNLKVVSLVPSARSPDPRVLYQTVMTECELWRLQDLIREALVKAVRS